MNFYKSKIFIFLSIWFTASALGLYLRLYTVRHHVPHEVEEKATILVIKNLQKQLNREQLAKVLQEDKDKFQATVAQVAEKLSTEIPPQENPYYLLASDSYYYYSLTSQILKTGHMSQEVKGSKYLNPLMNAPHGFWEPINIYPFIGVAVSKVVTFFNPHTPLMEAVSYTPLVITILIVGIFILGCYILGCGPGVSFLGAIALLCIPIFLRRSMFGWYDDDPPNIFCMFTILTVFFYGLKHLDKKRIPLSCALGIGVLFGVYSLFWHGWVFLLSMIVGSGFVMLVLIRTRNLAIYLGSTITATFIVISLLFGPHDFFILFQEGWVALQDFINPPLSLWPDLYLAVGELIPPKPSEWLNMTGGIFFITIGVIGLLSRVFILFKKPFSSEKLSVILLVLFAVVGVKLTLGAQRFGTLCVIPFAFAFVLGLQFLSDQGRKFLPKFSLVPTAIIALVLLTILPLWAAEKKTPQLLNKIFNSTWDRALTKIKNETPENSIVNTWWPPGHFIKAIAERRVMFDGATINKPAGYWLANVFLTDDEKLAGGILRMLNISGNDAVDELLKYGLSLSQAVDLLKQIVVLDQNDAAQLLKKTLTPEQSAHLLTLTHGTPPPGYLLIYKDMAEESLQFDFVGDWDFKTIEKISGSPELKKAVPKRKSPDYVPFLWKLAGGPPKYTAPLQAIKQNESMLLFDQNIIVDLKTLSGMVDSPQYGKGIPHSIIYENDGKFIEKIQANGRLPFSIVLWREPSGYFCRLTESSLGKSMLFRMYYFGGKGLKLFEPFAAEQDQTGRTKILVYKINWEQK